MMSNIQSHVRVDFCALLILEMLENVCMQKGHAKKKIMWYKMLCIFSAEFVIVSAKLYP